MKFPVTAALLALVLIASSSIGARAQTIAPTINQQLLQQLYLLPHAPLLTEIDVTVGTSAAQVLKLDPARVEDVISDTGASNCSLSHSNQVTITQGILLVAGGGSLAEDFRGDLTTPTEELWAICSASGGTLHILTIDLQ